MEYSYYFYILSSTSDLETTINCRQENSDWKQFKNSIELVLPFQYLPNKQEN